MKKQPPTQRGCPRCGKQATLSPINKVCQWCMDEAIFEQNPQRLYGKGYDLRPLRRIGAMVKS